MSFVKSAGHVCLPKQIRALRRDWQVLLPASTAVATSDMEVFKDCCVLYQRHNLQPVLTVLPLSSPVPATHQHGLPPQAQPAAASRRPRAPGQAEARRHTAPASSTHLSPGLNLEFSAQTAVSCTLEAPAAKPQRWQLDLLSGAWLRLQHTQPGPPPHNSTQTPQGPVPANLQQSAGSAQQPEEPAEASRSSVHQATSLDGTSIPLTLTQPPANVRPSGRGLLYVYGAYSLPLERTWSPLHGPLLARGWTIAHAHIRGGELAGCPGDPGRLHGGQSPSKGSCLDDLTNCCDPILHQRLDGAWLKASWQASLPCHSGKMLLPTGFYDALAWCALRAFNRAAEASQHIVHNCTSSRPGSWCQMCRLPARCDAVGQHQYPAGGDLGRHWHAAATRAGLPKRVEDLHACLLYLRRHLTQAAGRAAVVLHATSAGGVPAGAVLNLCPEVG